MIGKITNRKIRKRTAIKYKVRHMKAFKSPSGFM